MYRVPVLPFPASFAIVAGMDHQLTTTGFELPGYRIVRSLGVVRGITVRSRSVIGNALAGLQTIFGGNITILRDLCEKAREDAFEQLINHAEMQGANAIIGVRYESNDVMEGVTEVLCYGTAVIVEPAAV